jgi:hypothetical protein
MKIVKKDVKNINLDFFNPLISEFPYLKSEKEQYRLLVYIANLYDNITIIDAGTCQGHSCLSLSQNLKNKVITYDILKNQSLCDLDSRPNVERKILDINKEADEVIKSAKIILLDIDPHDGKQEIIFYERLKNIGYKGYVIVDDINLNKLMIEFWNSITHDKYDITDIAHWSGTGIINIGENNLEIND